MRRASMLRVLITGAVVCALMAGVATVAVAIPPGTTSNDQSPMLHSLSEPCDPPSSDALGDESGNVAVHRNPDGTVTVNVNIRNGVPDATYLMSITCVEYFGTLTTNSEGQAAGHFVVSDVPPVFHVRAYDAADNDRFHSQTLTAG